MIHILLADHHPASLWALKTMVAEEPDFELVGEATEIDLLRELSKEHHPHLILIDIELLGAHIEDMITELHSLDPRPILIVMSSDSEQARVTLRAGADVFVSKGDQVDWLIKVLNKYKQSIHEAQNNITKEKE